MQTLDQQAIIATAISRVAEAGPQSTGGRWLENLTVDVAPFIRDWNIAECWHWAEWPERPQVYQRSTLQDVGIDVVARRRDGEYIAIQCKARQLDGAGQGKSITRSDLDTFIATTSALFWAERWVVTNGDSPMSPNIAAAIPAGQSPIKLMDIASDLLQQQQADSSDEQCEHCEPNPDSEERRQSKSCMQAEAIAESVRILREQETSESGGLPTSQARGKIIPPCGTGKTRISCASLRN